MQLTDLLRRAPSGDQGALDDALPLVYTVTALAHDRVREVLKKYNRR